MPRQASEDALIWQMTRKHFEARQRYMAVGGQWGSLSQDQRDIEYDAMWHALHELLVPSQEMIKAGHEATALEFDLGAAYTKLFAAMINKLLEV